MSDLKNSIELDFNFDTVFVEHPWAKFWMIRVSQGFGLVISDFLSDIEEIMRSKKPNLAFFMITEDCVAHNADDISVPYQKKLRVFIETKHTVDARDSAIAHITNRAIKMSMETCCNCGKKLELVNINNEDDRKKYPFLPTVTENLGAGYICTSCAFRSWKKKKLITWKDA